MGKRKLCSDVCKNSERKRQRQVHDIQCPIEEPFVVKVSLDIYYSSVASNLHILWKRLSNFKPPSGFYIKSIQREGKVTLLMICRDDGEFPCVITINCDFSWSFTINTVVLSDCPRNSWKTYQCHCNLKPAHWSSKLVSLFW